MKISKFNERQSEVLWCFVAALSGGLAGLVGALVLRFDFDPSEVLRWNRIAYPLIPLVASRVLAYHSYRVFADSPNRFSLPEILKLAKAHFFASILWVALVLYLRVDEFPRSVPFLEGVLSFLFLTGTIVALRLRKERLSQFARVRNTIVIGTGAVSDWLLRSAVEEGALGLHILCMLDDDSHLWGKQIHGVKVQGGVEQLESLLTSGPRVDMVLIAVPEIADGISRRISDLCEQKKVSLKRLPSFEEFAVESLGASNKTHSEEALLGKPVVIEHPMFLREALAEKTVLITGAGGSIGSEIVIQLSLLRVSKLILVDNCEYNLFAIDRRLQRLLPESKYRLVLADIRDRTRLQKLFQEESPDVVFHAAALKHVPLTELNQGEAFRTNVIGTVNVLEESLQSNVRQFVFISSDKAADPSNILGLTKLIGERLVEAVSGESSDLQAASVRFGNVINSSGSVIPLFREQILAGGPITVTHPDMERYFMSRQEAVQLVLQAGIQGKCGLVYVLDMGRSVKIVEVAQQMASLYGRPNTKIVFSGIRPGERLQERILSEGESLEPTALSKIGVIRRTPLLTMDVIAQLRDLETQVISGSNPDIAEALRLLFAQGTGGALEPDEPPSTTRH